MPIMNTRKPNTNKKTATSSVLDRVLSHSQTNEEIPYIVEDVLPAGRYCIKIIAVHETKTEKGKVAVDVVYRVTDAKEKVVKVKERYAVESYSFEKFVDYLFDAGLLSGEPTIAQLVGICEEAEATYERKGKIGRFKNRRPCKQDNIKTGKTKMVESVTWHDEEEAVDEYDLLEEDDDLLDDDE